MYLYLIENASQTTAKHKQVIAAVVAAPSVDEAENLIISEADANASEGSPRECWYDSETMCLGPYPGASGIIKRVWF